MPALSEKEADELFAALDRGDAENEMLSKALDLTQRYNAGTVTAAELAIVEKAAKGKGRTDKTEPDPDPGGDDDDQGDPDDEKLDGEGDDTPPPPASRTAKPGDEGPDVGGKKVKKSASTPPVTVPDPSALEEAVRAGEDGNPIFDMIEPMEAIGKSFGSLAESQAAMLALMTQATPSGEVKALTTLVKSLAGQVAAQSTQLAELRRDLFASPQQRVQKALQNKTADDLRQLMGVDRRLGEIENALNGRPFSPHPQPAGVRKSAAAAGAGGDIRVGQAIEAIQKSVTLKPDQKAMVLEQLQYAPDAGVSYAEIVNRADPAALASIA